ncbi:MAG: hypothetical protein JSR45_17775 [Proteobacteria bacterium]|nr:hypothetical protein [Pseudomonadota bacterium]
MWDTKIVNNSSAAVTANGRTVQPGASVVIPYAPTGVTVRTPAGEVAALEPDGSYRQHVTTTWAVMIRSGDYLTYWGYEGGPQMPIVLNADGTFTVDDRVKNIPIRGGESSIGQIEHVVLLMLENRTFDSQLGWLYEHDTPTFLGEATAPYRGLQSINPNDFVNTALDGTLSSPPVRGVRGYSSPSISPGEEFGHVNMQFFETEDPKVGAKPTMKGVLKDYVRVLQKLKFSDADIRARAPMIMETYTPSQLPVLNQLAKHYAVSDGWFASVPSQTNPNRAFAMCGTSEGLVNNGDLEGPEAKALEKVLGMAIGDDRFDRTTIFNAISEGGKDWAVFWQTSYLPQKMSSLLAAVPYLSVLLPLIGPIGMALSALLTALTPFTRYLGELTSGALGSCYTWRLFPHVQKIRDADKRFLKLDMFHALARSGRLPKFSYIEPFWTISQSSVDDGLKKLVTAMGNDYHPPCNMIVAEQFVKKVYESLIANREAWSKTLLIITFDEFVGTFDHVPPPNNAVPPWGPDGKPRFESPTKFKFDRFGGRVPAILVSPLVQKQAVFRAGGDTPYDHTSIIATVLKWLGLSARLPDFGQRAMKAPTFERAVTLKTPRTDERDLDFLKTAHQLGDPLRYGDPFVLKNQSGNYLTAFVNTWKTAAGSVLPDALLGVGGDLDLAAQFPTLGSGGKAQLMFVNHAPDRPANIRHGDETQLVSLEPGLNANNFLGSWADSHDCYYYNTYLQGGYEANQTWKIEKLDNRDRPLSYGDRVYLVNKHDGDKRLTTDTRIFQSKWITTAAGGDFWVIEPA